MFDTADVAMRFEKIEPRRMEKDDLEIGLLEIELTVNPFTAELAKELDDYVRRILFTSTDAEVTRKLRSASFDLTIQPQRVEVRMAPDQAEESFELQEVKILSVIARRGKKSSAWRLHVKLRCAPSSEHQLAQVIDCYTKMRYLTFEATQGDLFTEVGKERAKTRKARKQAAAGSGEAVAH